MRIINNNICINCCFCIEDYDTEGFCCKDNIYKPININQKACKFFCNDNNDSFNDNIKNNFFYDNEDEFDI